MTPTPDLRQVPLPQSDPHRPVYHFAAPLGTWINDPVPFYDAATDTYHVFLQHNPSAPVWGDMHWLHVSSRDLLTWTNHGVALSPSRTPGDPDLGGVWTGCITRQPSSGKYVALYTAIPTHAPFTQVQCAAVSDDLFTWQKRGVVAGLCDKPHGYGDCFRDPQTFQTPDGRWFCVIGGEQLGGKSGSRSDTVTDGGVAFLYEATDDTLLSWRYRHVLFAGDADTGYDFECPDFFPLPGTDKWVLITSRGKSWWHVGTLDADTLIFTREAWGACDTDLFYAAKSCAGANGERLLFGWIQEERPEAEQIAARWSGVLSLPRHVLPDGNGGVRIAPREPWLPEASADGSVFEMVTGDNRVTTTRRYA